MRRLFLILALLCVASLPAIAPTQSAQASPAITARKEQTVYITRTGAKYHRGSCRYLHSSKIAIKKSEARAQGYDPCKVCRP